MSFIKLVLSRGVKWTGQNVVGKARRKDATY
jgi:hypothetical protein